MVYTKALVLVGPKLVRISQQDVAEIRLLISRNGDLSFLRTAVANLETLWPTIVETLPQLADTRGDKALRSLRRFFQGEQNDLLSGERYNNIVLDVVTVLSQIVDFWRLATTKIDNSIFGPPFNPLRSLSDIQGFCLGFLTAAAVASAKDKAAFEHNAAAALRIAVCIGALVEADAVQLERLEDHATFLSVAYRSQVEYDQLSKMLGGDASPEKGYIACITDRGRATVTIPGRNASDFQFRLKTMGISVQAVPHLQGRYHNASVYAMSAGPIKELFRRDVRFQLPSAAGLMLPLRSNTHGELIKAGRIHEIALDSILLQQCQWFDTVQNAATQSGILQEDIFQAGASSAVPRSLRPTNRALVQNEIDEATAVAVIGMGCRYPDADSLEEFWDLISAGRSAVRTLPSDRFNPSDVTREPRLGYHGNFIRHPDHFDHRFFGLSGREAKSMDPQQRLALQVAYEALESAGYFGVQAKQSIVDRDVGCYVGVVAIDYEHNVASHDANAFSAMGTLRAFVSGRISHYFGWSGPSVVYDTACSSSAVAIHSAVQAIKSGECSMALAGGVNVLTSPAMWQNLAAGSFLSPTGASKAFDAGANGYCRGEGAGMVLLKSLKQARADGDSILAVITGSAVNQGSNCTPITVPASQSDLYTKVLSVAGINAHEVSYIEAHGTGTPVGDPIECESIRKTLGGPDRAYELRLGSVKDNIGHCEGASGVAALIKVVLMMQKRTIPKQANFQKLNPKIAALEPDRMAIAVQTQPWTVPKLIAVVNNYGAAGSNAALVVQHHQPVSVIANSDGLYGSALLPFIISAKTRESLQAYCTVLKSALPLLQETNGATATAALAYNLSVKQNRSFEHVYSFTASSLSEVAAALDRSTEWSQVGRTQHRPIVLCIGGQNGRTVHLDEAVFRNSKLLRKHLGDCERACQVLHLPTLFPAIFSPEPVEDLVSLHSLLFALQYSSAKAWLDCGLTVDTIIGHSFGQLTALAVSGALSLIDALCFISSRARLIQTSWGQETGAMLAVQGDKKTVDGLVQRTRSHYPALAVEVACYNGPQSIVLAGHGASIDALEEMTEVKEFSSGKLRVTRLKTTHAFHSAQVDTILLGLRQVADKLDFKPPSIRIEACAEGQDWNREISSEMLVQHSRMPVYFGDAVQRTVTRLGSCVFLEAGSASPIVPMARRALSVASSSSDADNEHFFQPIDLGPPNSIAKLSRAVSNLWATGVNVQFWPFHRIQKESFAWFNLPPYQFQKNSHWIDYVVPKAAVVVPDPTTLPAAPAIEQQLVEPYEHDALEPATFLINTTHAIFKHCVQGHAVLGQSLCPASMYVELAIRAVGLLRDGAVGSSSRAPCVKDLQIPSPMSMGIGRAVFIQLEPVGSSEEFAFTVLSRDKPGAAASTKHASGVLTLVADASRMQLVQRLVGQQAKYDKLAKSSSSQVLNGPIVYQVFSKVVDYAPFYKGIIQIVSKGNEALAKVQMPALPSPAFMDEVVCDPIALDNFLQVAGIHINCLSESNASEVFVCTELGEMLLSDGFLAVRQRETQSYKVYSSSLRTATAKSIVNDILIFDAETDDLIVVFSGVIFQSVSIKSLARTLAKVNGDVGSADIHQSVVIPKSQPAPKSSVIQGATDHVVPAKASVLSQVCELFSQVIEIPVDDVQPTATLEDLGVDSLMSTEILNEIKKRFDVAISVDVFVTLTDVQSVAQLLGGGNDETPSTAAVPHTSNVQTSKSGNDGFTNAFAQLQMLVAGLVEIPADEIAADTSLSELGIDSLMATELLNEIKTQFGTSIPVEELAEIPHVLALATRLQSSTSSTSPPGTLTPPTPYIPRTPAVSGPEAVQDVILNSVTNGLSAVVDSSTSVVATIAQQSFVKVRGDFDAISRDVGFAGFYSAVYPAQMELVIAYITEAFASMGCSLAALRPDDMVPDVKVLIQHDKLKRQLYRALEDTNIIKQDTAGRFIRTTVSVPQVQSELLLEDILTKIPQYAFEHKLLASTGAKLAECLTGKTDPLAIMFGSAQARTLMGNVYANAPMFKAITINLGRYLVQVLESFPESRPIRILEIGAGTGGTTMHLVERLTATHKKFEYTFTDVSSSLVAAAKRKFAKHDFMRYTVLNIEEEPATQFLHQYDMIISTNCIHATRHLTATCANINKYLRPDGVVCLVEATRNLYWYDLVWGLVDGWWLFSDGRQHALASEDLWQNHLSRAGFRWIDWTTGTSDESNVMRIITASPTEVLGANEPVTMETVIFKQEDSLPLHADIYYPKELSEDHKVPSNRCVNTRPI